jgi:hypothetical protein
MMGFGGDVGFCLAPWFANISFRWDVEGGIIPMFEP